MPSGSGYCANLSPCPYVTQYIFVTLKPSKSRGYFRVADHSDGVDTLPTTGLRDSDSDRITSGYAVTRSEFAISSSYLARKRTQCRRLEFESSMGTFFRSLSTRVGACRCRLEAVHSPAPAHAGYRLLTVLPSAPCAPLCPNIYIARFFSKPPGLTSTFFKVFSSSLFRPPELLGFAQVGDSVPEPLGFNAFRPEWLAVHWRDPNGG